jgi:drug/metabolite transporter (DMT)-like permease
MLFPETLSARARYGLGAVLVLLGAAGFSAKAVLIRLTYQQYPIDSLTLLTLRMLFSVPFYVVIALRLRRQPGYAPLPVRQFLTVVGLGLTGYYAASLLDFMGLQYVTASVERLILFVYPTIVLLVSALFFGKPIHRVQAVALLLTYAGIALAFLDNIDPHLQTNLPLGAALIFASALAYALYLVGAGEVIARVGSGRFTCYAMLAAAGGTFLHFLATRPLSLLTHLPGRVYALGGWIAIISTVLPAFLTAEGIRLIGPANTSIVGSAGPVITIGLAYAVLGETVGFWQGLGTALVLAGVLLISLKGKK